MTNRSIVALDQGTTSTRAVVFDESAREVASSRRDLTQSYPEPGWVEHDPEEIFAASVQVVKEAVERARSDGASAEPAAIGITNQRETTVVWERSTGEAVANAVVWQCRRTADMCAQLASEGHTGEVRRRTGLVIDPYFSATKLRWLLDHVPDGQVRAEGGGLCFGTVDSWLLFRLTGGRVHATDATNAARTMLFNLRDLAWDDAMLSLFDIPKVMLPEVKPSSGAFGVTDAAILGAEMPITGIAGDQHAALYGQACFEEGMSKCTYGTGAFVLANAGATAPESPKGLLATLAWQTPERTIYALEGSVFATGSTIQWLRDGLGMIFDPAETELLATAVPGNAGVYLVPAFTGLGSPYWDPHARAAIVGLTRGAHRAHFARAALESTAYQVRDVIDAMARSGNANAIRSYPLRVDGGQTVNEFLMQFQADLLDRPVEVAAVAESTALGAAFLAGRGIGVWRDEARLAKLWQAARRFEPNMSASLRDHLYSGWQDAVARVRLA